MYRTIQLVYACSVRGLRRRYLIRSRTACRSKDFGGISQVRDWELSDQEQKSAILRQVPNCRRRAKMWVYPKNASSSRSDRLSHWTTHPSPEATLSSPDGPR